jgi:hypothetical protein
MYLTHFHLVEKPFEYLIPNPRYFWYSPQSEGIKVECPPIDSTDLDDLTCKLLEEADLRCVKGRATP